MVVCDKRRGIRSLSASRDTSSENMLFNSRIHSNKEEDNDYKGTNLDDS